MSKKHDSTMSELYPCLREFLNTSEGRTVTQGELGLLIQMERTFRETMRSLGRDTAQSVGAWRDALAQMRCLHRIDEEPELCGSSRRHACAVRRAHVSCSMTLEGTSQTHVRLSAA